MAVQRDHHRQAVAVVKDQGGYVATPAGEVGDLDHVVIDAGIQQLDFQLLGLVGEALDVQHGVFGHHPLPGGSGQIGVMVGQPFQPDQPRLAVLLHPCGVSRVEQVQMLAQRPVDFFVGGHQPRRGRGVAKGPAQRLLLGTLVIQRAVGNQPGGLVGHLGAQIVVGIPGQGGEGGSHC